MNPNYIRQLFLLSARARGHGWSGKDELLPKMTEWKSISPSDAPSPMSRSRHATTTWLQRQQEEDEDLQSSIESAPEEPEDRAWKRRVQDSVYIVGFHTERAMNHFVHFWHRRSMEWEGLDKPEGELPPIANVEVLW